MSFLRDKKELFAALLKAQAEEGFGGICLTNTDPKADWLAITEKNRPILNKNSLCISSLVDKRENGLVDVASIFCHEKSGQSLKSTITLHKGKNGEVDPRQIFIVRRMQYEMLLGIASSNDATEAELLGPKRKHREVVALYDKNADFIDFDLIDENGEVLEVKVDRKKFESSFLGMTSEEEEVAEFNVPDFQRFSWGDIKLFLQCPRCFYNAKKRGLKPPVFDSEGFADLV